MTNNFSLEKSSSKRFISNNRSLLKEYAQKNQETFGLGIIVVNLLLLKTDKINKSDLFSSDLVNHKEPTIHQAISYLPQHNFWFKTISLKIKQKYQIDIHDKDNADQSLVVFIKDTALEHFSIYTINPGTSDD